MALQDLTPQLRTRLSRMERAVGWFILLAALLLLFGFGYYIYSTAKSRGWFLVKAPYFTYAESGDGLAVGDPVKLMGFSAGHITEIKPSRPWGPGSEHKVYIKFEVFEEDFGYLWTEGSQVQMKEKLLSGKRELDLTRGTGGHATYVTWPLLKIALTDVENAPIHPGWRLGEDVYDASGTNLEVKAFEPVTKEMVQKIAALGRTNIIIIDQSTKKKEVTAVWNDKEARYDPFAKTNIYVLVPDESPALTERLQTMVGQIQAALPGVLDLTNKISVVLSNSSQLTSNLNLVAENARPVITNLSVITANLKNPKGSFGEWLIPTNIHQQLETTLQNANVTITNADTNLVVLMESLTRSLNNLADITSNLNQQVQVNTNILTRLSDAVVHSDQFIQGLKHHWLLRSAFRTPKTNAPSARPVTPTRSPKAQSEQE